MIHSIAQQATTMNLGAIDVMALWQNAPKDPQAALQVTVVSESSNSVKYTMNV